MLILTRGEGEHVRIGDDITVTVVKVKDNGDVRLGFEAPPEVPVHRGEVYDAIHRNKDRESEGGKG